MVNIIRPLMAVLLVLFALPLSAQQEVEPLPGSLSGITAPQGTAGIPVPEGGLIPIIT
jgi:hypothetical protein